MKKGALLIALLFGTVVLRPLTAAIDTTTLFYPTNVHLLSSVQKQSIDSLIDVWKNDFPVRIEIIGYTDHVGDSVANWKLSTLRAQHVKQHITRKIPDRFIQKCKGNGELASNVDDTAGVLDHRRVDVISHFKDKAEVVTTANVTALFDLDTVTTGSNLRIPNLNFYPGRHIPLPESQPIFPRLLKTMQDNPSLKIEIHGHICCQMDKTDGLDAGTGEFKLSENRAQFVYTYLLKNGVDASRMSYMGFGRTRPLVRHERNEHDRMLNRRVEIKVISK